MITITRLARAGLLSAGVLGAGTRVAACGGGSESTAVVVPPPPPSATAVVVQLHTGIANALCFTIDPPTGAPGALGACDDGDARQRVTRSTSGELRTTGGRCVAAPAVSATRATDVSVTAATCDGSARQQWDVTAAGELRTGGTDCLAVWGGGRTAGTPVQTAPCDASTGQRWTLVTPPAATATPAPMVTVAAVRIAPGALTLRVGEQAPLVATAVDSGGRPVVGRTTTWASSDAGVASVAGGAVTALRAGTATVSASIEGVRATATLRVTAGPVVVLQPGQSIQAAVDANPAGTTFTLRAGVYHGQSIVPKDGDRFHGDSGAVLTGDDTAVYAFRHANGVYPRDVGLDHLVIEHYRPPQQFGAVLAGTGDAGVSAPGWTVADCEIRFNAAAGVRIGDRMQLLRNYVHHNGQIGITGIGDDVLVEGNEIAYNNPARAFDWQWEAGGTKFVLTNRLVVRGNFSHHNVGPGLWTDIDNRATLYEDNRVEDNAGPGILHEISWAAVIRNNVARRNGFDTPALPWVHGAGILAQNSSDVEVYGNTVEDNYNGITAIHQERGAGLYGPWQTRNFFVHDNVIRMGSGGTGIAQDTPHPDVFTGWNNRFERNHYQIRPGDLAFRWSGPWIAADGWRAAGQDVLGTFDAY